MTECKKCGSKITFNKIGNTWFPVNLDGTEHHDVCRDILNAKIKKEGIAFSGGKGSGFVYRGKHHFTVLKAKIIRGAQYREINHTCGLLPWESCNCEGMVE